MDRLPPLHVISPLVASAAGGTFFGVTMLASTFPHFKKAKSGMGATGGPTVPQLLDEWRRFYSTASKFQPTLVALATLGAGHAASTRWETRPGYAFLVAALAFGAVLPFSLLQVVSVDKMLMADEPVNPEASKAVHAELLSKWGKLNDVRTVLGAVGVASTIAGLGYLISK